MLVQPYFKVGSLLGCNICAMLHSYSLHAGYFCMLAGFCFNFDHICIQYLYHLINFCLYCDQNVQRLKQGFIAKNWNLSQHHALLAREN